MERSEVIKLLKTVEGLSKEELMILQDVISLSLNENSGLHGKKEVIISKKFIKKILTQGTGSNARPKVSQPTRAADQEERPRTFFDPSNFILDN